MEFLLPITFIQKRLRKGHREIPCGAGFEQSNPLLVTTSSAQKTQYWRQQNEPEHIAEFQAVRSGFRCSDWRSQKISKSFCQFLRSRVVVDYREASPFLNHQPAEEECNANGRRSDS